MVCINTGLVVVSEMQRSPSLQSSKLQFSCRGPGVGCDMVRSTAEESALISLEFMFLRLCTSTTTISLKIKLRLGEIEQLICLFANVYFLKKKFFKKNLFVTAAFLFRSIPQLSDIKAGF